MNKKIIFILIIILLILSIFLNLSYGGSRINLLDIIKFIFNPDSVENADRYSAIIYKVRLPRAIVTLFAGACLATSGVLIQAVMKNPLADSGILGIQSGATLVALVIILIMPQYVYIMPLAAFIGGILVYLILMMTTFKSGLNPLRLVLTGVAVNALLGSVIGLITIFNSDKIENALSWLNGSFAKVSTDEAITISIYGTIALAIAIILIKKCNLLLLDDASIITLGENLPFIRFIVASVAVLLASLSVSVVGIIGFVGLVVPHIGRMIVGTRHEYLIPFSIIVGAILTLFADGMQKIVFNPIEIPAGIIISFIGASFFFYLLAKESKI